VWLNRPERRNAFDAQVIADLTQTFQTLSEDPHVRVVVLGAHGKAFCAGADLNWMQSMADFSWTENHEDASRLAQMLWTIDRCPVPVIAEMQGDCYGGGVGLAATCDIVVAAREAHFCLSEVKLGLIPATISPYVMRAIGERAARRYFVTAERFNAARAQDLGLVHEVCELAKLSSTVDTLVHAIVHNGPQAVRACKHLVHELTLVPPGTDMRDDTARRMADIRASDEGREGMRAFLNKATPPWTPTAAEIELIQAQRSAP
jgi:methylglutaconyl-CoA hydratase